MTRILNYLQNKTKFADLCCVKPEIQAFHSHGIVKNVTNPPFSGAQYKKCDPKTVDIDPLQTQVFHLSN